MSINSTDHLLAVITPGLLYAVSLGTTWGGFLLMPVLYFVFRRLSMPLAKDCTLKLFDLTLSLMLIGLVLGGFLAALNLVARDGEMHIPLISDGLFVYVLGLLGAIYYTVCVLLLSIKTYQSKPYTAKLSMGIFEALRGKRTPAVE